MATGKRGSRRRAGRRRPAKAKAKRRTRPAGPPKRAAKRRPAKAARKKAAKGRRSRSPARQSRPAAKRRTARRPARKAARRDAPTSILSRIRRQLSESERLAVPSPTAAVSTDRMIQAARSGHDELRIRLQKHTETSPVLTADDPDAKWEDAYAVGDEAPGGDNPTPDQDRVDDIGKALGIRYRADEELKGGDEVAARDRRRWELDPASSEDWPHDKKKR